MKYTKQHINKINGGGDEGKIMSDVYCTFKFQVNNTTRAKVK